MEQLSIRDWMVIIGGMMIAAVLIDAVRRYWRERRAEIRLNAKIDRAAPLSDDDDPFNLLTELPNGGARIVRRDDLQDGDSDLQEAEAPPEPGDDTPDIPSMRAVRDPIDVAVEALDEAEQGGEGSDDAVGASVAASQDPVPEEDATPPASTSDASPVADTGTTVNPRRRTIKPPADNAVVEQETAPDPGTLDWLDTLDTLDTSENAKQETVGAEPEALPADSPEHGRLPRGADTHVFILYVVARTEEGFSGTDILETLLACDLRFGDMDFFHRHERASGRGPIEFSVANMMKPGVFDIDNMEPLQTRGLMFFVTLPGPADMLKAFDYMYETVKVVAKQLSGDIQDETRSVVTRQSLEHMRQQIRELERRLLVRRN